MTELHGLRTKFLTRDFLPIGVEELAIEHRSVDVCRAGQPSALREHVQRFSVAGGMK
jgi:hypothetical protein